MASGARRSRCSMKKFFEEFKEFAVKGNVMDMAVGIIIGGAFTAIVTSLVNDIINPLIGTLIGMNFSKLVATVNGAEIAYGNFIMAIVNFIIVALVIFTIIKNMNKLREATKQPEEEPAEGYARSANPRFPSRLHAARTAHRSLRNNHIKAHRPAGRLTRTAGFTQEAALC